LSEIIILLRFVHASCDWIPISGSGLPIDGLWGWQDGFLRMTMTGKDSCSGWAKCANATVGGFTLGCYGQTFSTAGGNSVSRLVVTVSKDAKQESEFKKLMTLLKCVT
jgi:hypothetical protein